MGLILSLVCGLPTIRGREQGQDRRKIILEILAIALVPLLFSIISLLWLPNCAFWDGVIFYVEVSMPSALLGAGFGFVASKYFTTTRKSRTAFSLFWVASLILSLLPGYFNPQLFTYGWQYGFFPGFIWDEALELNNAYAFSRLEQVIWLLLLFSLLASTRRTVVIAALGAAAIAIFLLHDRIGITSSNRSVERTLTQTITLRDHATLHLKRGSLDPFEIRKLANNLHWYFHDIRNRFRLSDTSSAVDVYIYPSVDELYDAIGTRSASIAKPWLGAVHITQGNLSSLKHELTHVLLREIGVFPFYASYSTGLTEGAAMSVEPQYDGLYTLDEHAEQILQMHYAHGVSGVMAFTGFAANASQKSYVLAGSFSRYLLTEYGPKPFKRVYRSLAFNEEYGVPLDTLEARWKKWLTQFVLPLGVEDTARLRYYYDRSSIIYQPCVRRIGKLERKASEAYKEKQYAEALYYYQTASREGGGLSPLIGESNALFQMGRVKEALAVLDTPKSIDAAKQLPALFLRKGDLHLFLGDTTSAKVDYSNAERLRLSANAFLAAYIRSELVGSSVRDLYRQYLWQAYHEGKKKTMMSLLDTMYRSANREPAHGVLTYLTILNAPEDRDEESYYYRWPNATTFDDSLANYLMPQVLEEKNQSGYGMNNPAPERFTRASEERNAEFLKEQEFLESRR